MIIAKATPGNTPGWYLQDVEGLIKLIGGDAAFVQRLDEFFKLKIEFDPNSPPDISGMIGQYAHGNEPGHHTTYLYCLRRSAMENSGENPLYFERTIPQHYRWHQR